MEPSKIRQKIGRFRILVIGRANAGKTTILQRVCNTRENPEIYNGAGKKIDSAVLTASREDSSFTIHVVSRQAVKLNLSK
jgi:GTPase SAR1 family protein